MQKGHQKKRTFISRNPVSTDRNPCAADIIYGKNPVVEVLRAGRRKIKELVLCDAIDEAHEPELVALARAAAIKVRHANASELARLTGDGVHQGVVAYVGALPEVSLSELVAESAPKELVLMLDCVQDPQNLGTLCRSSLAFGVRFVILPRDRSALISPAVVKASAGAVEHLKIVFVTNLVQTMETLKKEGFWLYGASLSPESVSLPQIDPAARSVVVLGSEGKGLRRLVTERCDVLMTIPMKAGFDSLNVAQAGTVLLYEFEKRISALS